MRFPPSHPGAYFSALQKGVSWTCFGFDPQSLRVQLTWNQTWGRALDPLWDQGHDLDLPMRVFPLPEAGGSQSSTSRSNGENRM